MQLGAHVLRNGLFVAPMAGVTDRPFRILCRRFGAGLAVSEMVSSRPELRDTPGARVAVGEFFDTLDGGGALSSLQAA